MKDENEEGRGNEKMSKETIKKDRRTERALKKKNLYSSQ